MDIDLLSKMVKELILDNEKVVLPGLGCFVAEVVPASFSDRGYTLNPPYRKIYFRSHPDEGHLLADLYAGSNKVQVEMADRILRDFLKELKSVLFTRKTVVFPGLGRMRATKENNIFFIADEELDIYPASFALETISLKSHQEQEARMTSALGQLKDMMSGLTPAAEPTDKSVAGPVAGPVDAELVVTEPVEELVVEPAVAGPVMAPVAELAEVEPSVTELVAESVVEPAAESAEAETAVEPEPTLVEAVEETVPETQESSYDAPVEEPEAPVEVVSVKDVSLPACGNESLEIEPVEEKPVDKRHSAGRTIGWIFGGLVLALAVLAGAFFLLDLFAPEVIDWLLYSEEELEVLNYGK